MKKILALLICLMLTISSCAAFAAEVPGLPFETPGEGDRSEPGTASGISEAVQIQYAGQTILMDFDPTPEFSFAKNGTVQASFYSYSANGAYLYEMYLTFPEGMTSGSIYTQDMAIQSGVTESCVAFLVSTANTEDYYLSAQYNGAAYPAGTDYTIRFDSVSDTAAGLCFTGTITACMVGEDINKNTISEKLYLTDAPFSFTLPAAAGSSVPAPGATPVPAPTVRPDMFRI